MTLDELAKQELELYSHTVELQGTIEEKADQVVYFGLTEKYQSIHRTYSLLSSVNIEALKRGLFISWYSIAEPTWLTGIGQLDIKAEEQIIKSLDNLLTSNATDFELDWMLDYYSTWDYIFERFSKFKAFQRRLALEPKTKLPDKIDRKEMNNRGQMGIYWNSLVRFNK